jgi:Sec-independent protein secretion pathway component TatC
MRHPPGWLFRRSGGDDAAAFYRLFNIEFSIPPPTDHIAKVAVNGPELRRRALRLSVAVAAAIGEMPFLEHLEEPRSRIIKALIALGASFVVCWYFSLQLFDFVAKPITRIAGVNLVIIDPTEAFTVYMKVSFVAALYLSAPFVLWQAWRFISPGLYKHERRYAGPFIISTTVFFLLGGVFGYTVAFPPWHCNFSWTWQNRVTWFP